MAKYCVVLCALLCLQGVWSNPAKSTDVKTSDETSKSDAASSASIGTQLSDNMNENLLKIMNNLRTGAVQMTTPVIKFGVDTVPNLFSAGFKTAADAASKIVEAKRKGFGKLINGVASVAGGGGVLASAIAGGNMQIVGSGLGVAGNLIDAAAKFGLNITGNLADTSALANMVMANLTNTVLKGAGKGMSLAGDGVNVLTQGSSELIRTIGGCVANSIGKAQDTMTKWMKSGSAKLQDGAMVLTTAAQVNYYNALQWYLHNLLAMEGVMDKLTETINSMGKKKTSSSDSTDSKKTDGESTDSDKTDGDSTDEKEKGQ